MSKLDSLYKDYVQKSRIFLYPMLDIKRGVSVTPIQTYIGWKEQYSFQSEKLICVYHLRKDEEFRLFEKQRLMGHPLFYDFKMTDDDKGVYVFDFSKHRHDWDNFLKGKYSKLSPDLKKKIRAFFGSANLGYIDSFLYPERYFKLYAELLTTQREDEGKMLGILREVGELCSKPDMEQELLIATVKDLHINPKSV
jgi:hypothetical protein